MESRKIETLHKFVDLNTRHIICQKDGKAPFDGKGSTQAPRRLHSDILKAMDTSGLNFGVTTGATEDGKILFVLDSDMKNDGEGCVKLLEALYGELPVTMTVATPSGGRHRYFYSPVLFTSSSGLFKDVFNGKCVDVKCAGGYVVAPPSSILGNSYVLMVDAPIAALPDAWIDAFKPVLAILGTDGKIDSASVVKADEFATLPVVPGFEGDIARCITHFNKAHPHLEYLEALGYTRTSRSRFTHPYDATSVDNVSVFPADRNRLPYLGADYVSFHRGANDAVPCSECQPRDSFDLFVYCVHHGNRLDALNAIRYEVEKVEKIASMVEDITPPASSNNDWRIRFDGDPEMYGGDMIIEDVLNMGELVMFFGPQASCKTFLALDMAFSLATGVPFLNKYEVARKRRYKSVLVLTEVGGGKAQNRINAWVKHRSSQTGIPEETLHAGIRENIAYTDRPCTCGVYGHNVESLEASLKERRPDFEPDIYVFDTLSQCYRGDENDNSQMAAYLAAVRGEVCSRGKTAVLIHHPTKSTENVARGASSLTNNLQLIYNIFPSEENPETIVVSRVKANDDVSNKPFALRKNVIQLGLNKRHIREDACLSSVVLDYEEYTAADMDAEVRDGIKERVLMVMEENGGWMSVASVVDAFNASQEDESRLLSNKTTKNAMARMFKEGEIYKKQEGRNVLYSVNKDGVKPSESSGETNVDSVVEHDGKA